MWISRNAQLQLKRAHIELHVNMLIMSRQSGCLESNGKFYNYGAEFTIRINLDRSCMQKARLWLCALRIVRLGLECLYLDIDIVSAPGLVILSYGLWSYFHERFERWYLVLQLWRLSIVHCTSFTAWYFYFWIRQNILRIDGENFVSLHQANSITGKRVC